MNNVNIVYSPSGLGTPAPGQDFISGLIFYGAPSGFTFEALSIRDAESNGITANTIANASAATYLDVIHYHISEYFRGNPTGDLFVNLVNSASTVTDYYDIVQLQNYANGNIRQMGVYEQVPFSATNLTAIQNQINANIANNMPHEVIYQCDYSGVTNFTSLIDLSTLTCPNVSVTFGQDGANLGDALFDVIGHSIGIVGITLGAVSSANVADSIAWVGQYNVSNVELATPAFANGILYNSVDANTVSHVDSQEYIFLRTFVGISGTYFNNDYTANNPTSDYDSIHLNRTVHKAARQVRTQILPSLASPVYFNKDGTIALNSIIFFKTEANVALAQMVSNNELSQFQTIIDASQNVLATKTLVITVQMVPVGVADTIIVNLGFVLSV